jgi:hypothetical protein
MRRLLAVLAGALVLLLATPGVATAYWLAADSSHSARATAGLLPAGAVPTAAASGRSVTVSFARAVTSAATGAVPLDSYRVQRYAAGTDAAVAWFDCTVTAGCVDAQVPDGQWVYTDTPLLGNWIGTAGPSSAAVLVDATAPTPTIATTATADTTPRITGSAGTAARDLPNVTVALYAGSALPGAGAKPLQSKTVRAIDGTWSWTTRRLAANASYTVLAKQADSFGNIGQNSGTFVIDTVSPVLSLAAVPATVDGNPTFHGTAGAVTASASSSADGSDLSVKVYAGRGACGRPVQTLTATRSGNTWSIASTGLASGRYTAQASQRDGAGNVSLSTARTFVVDASGPTVTIASPSGATNDGTPTVSGNAGTARGDLNTVTVRVVAGSSASGTPLQTLQRPASFGGWSGTLAALAPNQTYTVQAVQVDSFGNTSAASSTFVLDTVAPQVTLTAPAEGSLAPASPTFTGTAGTEPASATSAADDDTVTVRIYAGSSAGGAAVRTLTAAVSNGAYSVSSTALATGTYTAVTTQLDAAGNVSTSNAQTFSVDGAAPAVTLKPVAGYSTSTTPTFSGAAGTAPGDLAQVRVRLYAGPTASGTAVQTLTAGRSGGGWSVLVLSPLAANAQYTVLATQSDAAGNVGLSSTFTFTIDTSAPSGLAVVNHGSGETGLGARPILSGTAGTAAQSATTSSDSGTVTVKLYRGTSPGGAPDQTLVPAVGADGTWSVRIGNSNRLSTGQQYTVVISQRDELGNTASCGPITFTA